MSAPSAVARTPTDPTRQARGWRLPFQLWFPLVVYGVARTIGAAYLIAAATPAHRTGYGDLATAWDGGWYRIIANSGYPSSLPIGVDGAVQQNPWAFSPGYPLMVRALMAITGLDFSVVAPTLSLVLGAAAMVVIFALVERAVSRFAACATVILSCTFMSAPALQIAYAESLALLLLAGALFLLRERRYIAVAALILALALTRPVVLAFIPVVIAHAVGRWRGRAADPFPVRDQRAVAILAGWCLAATGLGPVIVAVGNRDLLAWTKAHEAWRTELQFAPGMGWPTTFLTSYGWPALVLLAVVVLLTLGIAVRPDAKAWGPELRCWSVAYPAFLLLATVPGPSVIRWLLLAFPLMWPFPEAAATPSERRFRVVFIAVLAVLGLAMQWVWISTFLGATPPSERFP